MPPFMSSVTDSMNALRYFHCSPSNPWLTLSRTLKPTLYGSIAAQYQFLSSSPTKTSSALQGELARGSIKALAETSDSSVTKFVIVQPRPSQLGQDGKVG